jgi:transcription elongation regulator 1
MECKILTHKTFEAIKENPNHLKEIEGILKKDKRYLVLDHLENERLQILMVSL